MSLLLDRQKQKERPNSGITALIDMDIVCYSCGFSSQHNIRTVTLVGEDEPRASFQYKKEMKEWIESEGLEEKDYVIDTRIEVEPVENALHPVKLFIENILEKTNAQYYKGFLTGKGNFREELATILPYKGNRRLPKPVHYDAIRQYLIDVWGAVVVDGMEADDMLAIEQTKWLENIDPMWLKMPEVLKNDCTVVCSIDKDLKQVTGWHFNWNKDEKPVWVSEEEALRNFYTQLLTGDMTDNIQGIQGIGPKKAEKILEGCKTEKEMYNAVVCAYENHLVMDKDYDYWEWMEEIVYPTVKENANLLFLIRELEADGITPKYWRSPE